MTTTEAHAILDAARDGAAVPGRLVDAALVETGDLPWTYSASQVTELMERIDAEQEIAA